MRVLFVSPSFYPAFHYGGPTFINHFFCEAMARQDNVHVDVLSTDANGPVRVDVGSARLNQHHYGITYCRRMFHPDIAPGLLLRLFGKIRRADAAHLCGAYSFTTSLTIALFGSLRKPVVWPAMGALQRWDGTTRSGLKRVWEVICNSISRPDRVLMHVTSEEERVESLGRIPNGGALLLRNGIEIPELKGESGERTD